MQAIFKLSDSVLSFFLRFIRVFLTVLGQFSQVVQEVTQALPSSLHVARNSGKVLNFHRYVVCRKCHRICFFRDCIDGAGVSQRSKTCQYVAFPLHPHLRMRSPCGTLLLKTVELAVGPVAILLSFSYLLLCEHRHLSSILSRPA